MGAIVEAPLSGKVLSIKVKQEDSVKEGDVLLILEAMKLEIEIVTPTSGVVKEIKTSIGQEAEIGAPLIVID
ncbi:MAG: biotin/lipoyl-containing protein [Candidatus Bathyarchaeia archaeon]